MNISLSISIFLLIFIEECGARSSGRGGGGGRGRSGSRSFSRSGGGKFHSSSSYSHISHGSSSFRSSVFKPSTSNTYFSAGSTETTGNTYIINHPATPIIYDNHYYYWHGYYRSRPEKKITCEYIITEEDGELFNVTYANGTSPKAISFGCGSFETCCGMSCCSTLGTWIVIFLCVIFTVVAVTYGCLNL